MYVHNIFLCTTYNIFTFWTNTFLFSPISVIWILLLMALQEGKRTRQLPGAPSLRGAHKDG